MVIKATILGCYLGGLFLVGWWVRSRWSASPENYFLADRTLGPVVFLATMAATNFSAFTVFGASGAGYRDGYAFYPLVGFGTGFMALTFWIVGRRARSLGRLKGAVTPPELVRAAYENRLVSTLFALVLIVFTIPYLALQPIAAGYALHELFGWDQLYGAGLITLVICAYTLRGGLRAVAWTDVFQGLVMFGVMALALVLIADQVHGMSRAGLRLFEEYPKLFSRPGAQDKYSISIWFSFIFLWFFCDPMFPQLFQRFMAARDERTLRRTMLWYPAVCSAVFLIPVTIGVLGRLNHPGLVGAEADRILPLMAADLGNQAFGALVITCGLAGLMSTMDSQLLTLSSIFSQDIFPLISKKQTRSAWPGRIFVVLLGGAGLALAINPPGTILAIAKVAFTGLAVLFPTVLFGLYPGWTSGPAAVASMVVGEGALVLNLAGIFPDFGFLSVVPIMVLTFGTYLGIAGAGRLRQGLKLVWPVSFLKSPFTWSFLFIFVLAMDWWQWGRTPYLIWGWPAWIFYFLFLSGLQTWIMARWTRPEPGPAAASETEGRIASSHVP